MPNEYSSHVIYKTYKYLYPIFPINHNTALTHSIISTSTYLTWHFHTKNKAKILGRNVYPEFLFPKQLGLFAFPLRSK